MLFECGVYIYGKSDIPNYENVPQRRGVVGGSGLVTPIWTGRQYYLIIPRESFKLKSECLIFLGDLVKTIISFKYSQFSSYCTLCKYKIGS